MQGYITPQSISPQGEIFNIVDTPLYTALFDNLFSIEFNQDIIPSISLLSLVKATYQDSPIQPEQSTRMGRFEEMRYTMITGNSGFIANQNATYANAAYKRVVSGLIYEARRTVKILSSSNPSGSLYPQTEFMTQFQVDQAPEMLFQKLRMIAGQLAKDINNQIASALFFNTLSPSTPTTNSADMPFVRWQVCMPSSTSFLRYERKYLSGSLVDDTFSLFCAQMKASGGWVLNNQPNAYFETIDGASSDLYEDIDSYMKAQGMDNYTVVMGRNVKKRIDATNFTGSRGYPQVKVVADPILDENPNCVITVPSITNQNIASLGLPLIIQDISISNNTIQSQTDPINQIPLLNITFQYNGGTVGLEVLLPNGVGSTMVSDNPGMSMPQFSAYFHPIIPIQTNIPINNNRGNGLNALSLQDCADQNRIVLYVNAPTKAIITPSNTTITIQVSIDQLALVGNKYGIEPNVVTGVTSYSDLIGFTARTATTAKLDWMICNSTTKKTPLYFNAFNVQMKPIFALADDALDGIFQVPNVFGENPKTKERLLNWSRKAQLRSKNSSIKYVNKINQSMNAERFSRFSGLRTLAEVRNALNESNTVIDMQQAIQNPNEPYATGTGSVHDIKDALIEVAQPMAATRLVTITSLLEQTGAASDLKSDFNITFTATFRLNAYPRRGSVMFLMGLPRTFAAIGNVVVGPYVGMSSTGEEIEHRLQFEPYESLLINNQYSVHQISDYFWNHCFKPLKSFKKDIRPRTLKEQDEYDDFARRHEVASKLANDFENVKAQLIDARKMLERLSLDVDCNSGVDPSVFINYCKNHKISRKVQELMVTYGYHFLHDEKERFLSA